MCLELFHPENNPTLQRTPGFETAPSSPIAVRSEQGMVNGNSRIASDAGFRGLLMSMVDWVWELDANFTYTFCSDGVKDLLGYQPSDLMGKRPADIMLPEDASRCWRLLDEAVVENKPVLDMKAFYVKASGELAPVITNIFPVLREDGQVMSICGVGKRLSVAQPVLLQEVEDAFQAAISRLRLAIEIGRLGTWEWDISENIIIVDSSWKVLMGFPEDGKDREVWNFWASRIHPEDRQPVLAALDHHLHVDLPFEIEYRWIHPENGEIWLNTSGQVTTRDAEGRTRSIMGVTQDVTARKQSEQSLRKSLEQLEASRQDALLLKQRAEEQRLQAEEALLELDRSKKLLIETKNAAEAASQEKSIFLANVSHEIRTPMNAVIGLTHLALQSRLTPVQRDYILKIQSSAKTLLDIINELLDFSKIEAGKMELEKVHFDLNCVLEDVATMVNLWVKEKNIEVIFDIQPDLQFFLIGDPLRLEQVMINLLNNAVKFTSDGEVVFTIRLISEEPNRVVMQFTIKDTGIGIEPDVIPKVFKAFSQADSSTTRVFGGTGLGLAIAKRLVELMGGTIWVESTRGVGTTFHFTARFGKAIKDKESPLPVQDTHSKRVLLVEDNPVCREVYRSYLNRFTVQMASGAAEALKFLFEEGVERIPDVLVLDNCLENTDGFSLARQIRKRIPAGRLPILLTVNPFEQEQANALAAELGLAGVLVKPLTQPLLLNPVLQSLFGSVLDTRPTLSDNVADLPWADQLQGARILLVEDNALNQEISASLLRSAGAQVEIAHNGQVGVDKAKAHPFDAILMDIQMPIMDGYQATSIIRQVLGLRDVPIIALTAHAMAGDRERSLQAGMNDHINKPIDPQEVFAVLGRWVHPDKQKEASCIRSPEEAPAIPELSGLDTVYGVKRVGGNPAIYRRLLLKFADTQADLLARARQALDKGDASAAAALVHIITGASGSLGAEALYGYCRDLEEAIRNPVPEGLPERLAKAEGELDKVLHSIAILKNQGD